MMPWIDVRMCVFGDDDDDRSMMVMQPDYRGALPYIMDRTPSTVVPISNVLLHSLWHPGASSFLPQGIHNTTINTTQQ